MFDVIDHRYDPSSGKQNTEYNFKETNWLKLINEIKYDIFGPEAGNLLCAQKLYFGVFEWWK